MCCAAAAASKGVDAMSFGIVSAFGMVYPVLFKANVELQVTAFLRRRSGAFEGMRAAAGI